MLTESEMIHPEIRVIGDYPHHREHPNSIQTFELLYVDICLEERVEVSFNRECG